MQEISMTTETANTYENLHRDGWQFNRAFEDEAVIEVTRRNPDNPLIREGMCIMADGSTRAGYYNVTMTKPDRNRVQLVSNLLSLLDTLDRAAAIKLRHNFAKPIEEGTVAAELVLVEAINAAAPEGAEFKMYPGTNNYGWWTVPHQLKRKG